MPVPTWLRRTLPITLGAAGALAMALTEWERAPQCIYPPGACRVGHPEDCGFPPCPAHGSVHWLAVAVVALLIAALTSLIMVAGSKGHD